MYHAQDLLKVKNDFSFEKIFWLFKFWRFYAFDVLLARVMEENSTATSIK